MTTNLLDYIFSSNAAGLFLFIGSIVLLGAAFWLLESSKERYRFYLLGAAMVLFLAVMFAPLLNATFWGFGRCTGLSEAYLGGSLLAGLENQRYSSKYEIDSPGRARLFLVDLDTGRKLLKKNICTANAEILGIRGNFVLIGKAAKEVWLVEIPGGEIVYHLDGDSLHDVLPQFRGGITEFRTVGGLWETTSLLEVTARDGRVSFVDLFTRTVVGREKMLDRGPYLARGAVASCKRELSARDLPFTLTTGVRRTVAGRRGISDERDFFIRGVLIQYDRNADNLYVMSYATADKTGERFTCLDGAGNRRWDLAVDSFFPVEELNPSLPVYSALYRGGLLFIHGPHVALVDGRNGAIRWTLRL